MPRLPQTERDKIRNNVGRTIAHYQSDSRRERNAFRDKAASALGFGSGETLRRKIHNPGGITLDELLSIANTLNISIYTLLGQKENQP